MHYTAKCISKYMASPCQHHWIAVKMAAKYLLDKLRMVQLFKFESEVHELKGYADSAWAGERPSMRSTSGGALTWGSSCLKSWSSTQTTVAFGFS